jgi:tRNA A-37 threonylcarbamoyl transferase component Bud32
MARPIESDQGSTGEPWDNEPVARALEQWRQLPEVDRERWLEELAQRDANVAAEVRSLVEYVTKDDFLSHKASNFVLAYEAETDGELVQGQQVGGYRLIKQLGEGGHGLVWSARDELGSEVAIKFLKSGLLSETARRRFVAEQRVLKELDDPGIARMIDAGVTEAGIPYLVLELIDGQDVVSFSKSHDLDLAARVRLVIQALHGLAAAHTRGVVHRDIKPSNLLVTGDAAMPRLRLIDFGVAKFEGTKDAASQSLTVTGQTLGTTNYMSPEQIADGAKDVGTASDLYSLAVVLYELLTGHLPYDRELLERSPHNAIQKSLPLPCQRWGTAVPAAIESVIARALRKEPHLRFSSAGDFARALEACLAGNTPESSWGRRSYAMQHFARRYWMPLAGAVLLLLVMSIATVVSTRWALIAERERDAAEFSSYRTTLSAVAKAIDGGDLESARNLLADTPTSTRGLEWGWLATMAAGSQEIWSEGEAIRTLAASEDGWWLGLMSGELVRLDKSGTVLWRATDVVSPLCVLAVGRGGSESTQFIVSGYADGTLIGRSISSPTAATWRLSLNGPVLAAAASSEGWVVATGQMVYRIDSRGVVLDQASLQGEVTAACVGPDASNLFLGMVDGRVRCLDWGSDEWSTLWSTGTAGSPVTAFEFTPAAAGSIATVWVARMNGELQQMNAVDGSSIGVPVLPNGKVVSIAVEPRSGTLAVGMRDGTVGTVVDPAVDAFDIRRDHEGMTRVAFREGALATAGWDGRVRVRRVQPANLAPAADQPGAIAAIAPSSSGAACAVWRSSSNTSDIVLRVEGGEPKTVSFSTTVLSIARGRQSWLVGNRDGAVHRVADDGSVHCLLTPDGVASMAVVEDHNGDLWKLSESGDCFLISEGKSTLIPHSKRGRFFGIAIPLDPRGGVAVTGDDGTVYAVSRKGTQRITDFKEQLAGIAFNTRDAWAAIPGGATRLLWMHDKNLSSMQSVTLDALATAGPAWTSEGHRIAVGQTSGHVSVVDAGQAASLAQIRVSDAPIRAVTIDGSGRLMVLDAQGVIRSITSK